jgi:hypothetical protein
MTEPKAAKPKQSPPPAEPEPAPEPAPEPPAPALGRAAESGDPAVHWLLARREAAAAPGSGLEGTVPAIDAELAGYGVGV